MTAIVVVLLVLLGVVLGVLAWRAGGPQPIGKVVVPIAVPGAAG
jgi:hypothetical protein